MSYGGRGRKKGKRREEEEGKGEWRGCSCRGYFLSPQYGCALVRSNFVLFDV